MKKDPVYDNQYIENCFRSAKIERSGFLHPAEFSEIYGAKDLSGFMRLSDLLNGEVRCKKPLRLIFALRIYAKNRCALFLHSGFMDMIF
ncbi:MAG: hypothetical protein BWK80_26575 [Desulfobacteraceae bacterium IS3]|nr:MAG: hypothetical protein BWK80_26575 [Desulfobacteraceae bacterium IS3]